MFLFLESLDDLTPLTDEYAKQSEVLSPHLVDQMEEVFVAGDQDINQMIGAGQVLIYISEGPVTISLKGNKILAFEEGEFFFRDSSTEHELFELSSEMAVRIKVLKSAAINPLLDPNPEVFSSISHLQDLFIQLLGNLLKDSPQFEGQFDPNVMTVDEGEVVLKEGEESDEIYSLAQGALEVTVNGVKVGEIHEGELFGVLAAFTNSPRTATVTATKRCLIMRLPKNQFDSLVRHRPALITSLVEGFARRIVSLNSQVLELKNKS